MRTVRNVSCALLAGAIVVMALTVSTDAGVAMVVGVVAGYLLGYGDGIVEVWRRR